MGNLTPAYKLDRRLKDGTNLLARSKDEPRSARIFLSAVTVSREGRARTDWLQSLTSRASQISVGRSSPA